jgi:hypothetical protein
LKESAAINTSENDAAIDTGEKHKIRNQYRRIAGEPQFGLDVLLFWPNSSD